MGGRRTLAAIALLALAGCIGCQRSTPTRVALDGSPRFGNDEGVATRVTRSRIVIDDKRAYRVAPRFVSFSTFTARPEPMRQRLHQYVLVGHHGRTIDWMAGVSTVIGTDKPQAFYQGRLLRVDDKHRMIFRDGTVLQLARNVAAPKRNQPASVIIDARRHTVVEVHQL